ncbi:MAG: hypothetical protein QOH03_4991 [Kribbellaceae bacterium]|nr:hypothetical protein [Kribbellaceae bacterium]
MGVFVKRRGIAPAGSVAAALGMFQAEVRFYREIAPVIGIRVPACDRAEDGPEGTLLELEDLSEWTPGAAPAAVGAVMRQLHTRWSGEVAERWPWLRAVAEEAGLIERLYDDAWPRLADRPELSEQVRKLGQSLVGNVVAAERQIATAGELTLVHGDLSAQNLRTSPAGEIALLDWEDVTAAPGAVDLAWFLLSSVEPADWPGTITAYGDDKGLYAVMPSAVVQGLLSLNDHPVGSPEATAWGRRLDGAAVVLAGA